MKKTRLVRNTKVKNKVSKSGKIWPMILGIIAILFSLKLIYSNLFQVSFNPGTSINQVGVADGRVTLTLTPESISIEPNTEQILTLKIDAGVDYATLAQIELVYDQTKIGTPIVTQGDFFSSSLGGTQVANGKINFSYSSGVPAEGQRAGKTGNGTLATIKITPPVVGSSTITFSDSSLVTLIDGASELAINSNMLKSANNVNIQVGSVIDSTSPSPTATTTTTVSPSPASSASTAPEIVASPSPDPTITPVKPNKPGNLLYNCFDNGTKITLRWDAVTGVSSYEVYLDHKDGDRDVRETVSGREKDVNITANTKYNWSLVSLKDGLKSDTATVNDISCAGTSNSGNTDSGSTNNQTAYIPPATPAPTKKPSIISSIKKAITPTKTATPKPTVAPSTKPNATVIDINKPSTPTPTPGSLADIYKNIPSPTPVREAEKAGLLSQIFLGWKAIFLRIFNIFSN